VSNGEPSTLACASESIQRRTLQRASGRPSCVIRLGVETALHRASVQRKAQLRRETSTTCCILLSAIKFKCRLHPGSY